MRKYRIYYSIVLFIMLCLFLWTNTAQVLLVLLMLCIFPLFFRSDLDDDLGLYAAV